MFRALFFAALFVGTLVWPWGSRATATRILLPATVTTDGATWTGIGNFDSVDRLGFAGTGLNIGDVLSHPGAYDGFHMLAVDGAPFANAAGDIAIDGTTMTSDTATTSGLEVRLLYFFHPSDPVVRTLALFRNPSAADIAATVRYGGDLGSDAETAVQATASGDLSISEADRWTITDDDPLTGDPANTIVFYGPGSPETAPTSITTPTAVIMGPQPETDLISDNIVANFDITVPAGDAVSLMWFGQVNGSSTGAIAEVERYNSMYSLYMNDYLTGLSAKDLATVANWEFSVMKIPEPSTFALAGLAMAGLGVLAWRRHRRRKCA